MTKKQLTTTLNSTKAIDELFIYAYKLRKAGIDPTVVEELTKAVLVGAPAVSFETSGEPLTKEQQKLIEILRANGFEVSQVSDTIIVKSKHFSELRDMVDKVLEESNDV